MITAGAPTKRTRHVDIRYFALLQWSDTGQLTAQSIPTAHNISNLMTKATGRIKFHQHVDLYMGRQPPPSYAPHCLPSLRPASMTITQAQTSLAPHHRSSTFAQHYHHSTHDMREVSALNFPVLHRALCNVFLPPRTEHGRVEGLQ